jgi:hypothetical protein
MSFCYLKVIVCSNDVELYIIFCIAECIQCLLYQRKGVLVLDCDVIEAMVVLANSDTTFWF